MSYSTLLNWFSDQTPLCAPAPQAGHKAGIVSLKQRIPVVAARSVRTEPRTDLFSPRKVTEVEDVFGLGIVGLTAHAAAAADPAISTQLRVTLRFHAPIQFLE